MASFASDLERAEAAEAQVAALTARVAALEAALDREKRRSRGSAGSGDRPPAGGAPPADAAGDAAFAPLRRYRSTARDGRPDAIVVVDPISTGARLAKVCVSARERGARAREAVVGFDFMVAFLRDRRVRP